VEFLIIVPLLWHFGGSVDSSKGGSLASRGGENAAADPNVVLVMDHEKILQVDIEDVRLLKDFPHHPYHWIPIGPFCLFQFARNWESRSRRMSRDQIFYPRAKTGFRRDLGGGGNSGARGRRRGRDQGPFTCDNGGVRLRPHEVNDDYCDCKDGTDETLTNACTNGHFACKESKVLISSAKM